MLEEHMEEKEDYNTEWNPYEDDEFEPESYENYEDEDEEF